MESDDWVCKNTPFSFKHSLNCRGKKLDLSKPAVMGILNLTPDSFYDGGRYGKEEEYLSRAGLMLEEGAAIIDVGAVSTKPFAKEVTAEEEIRRLLPALKRLRNTFPDAILSVDTYRANVAQEALENGADMINDISAGTFDPDILQVAAAHQVPYVMMHILGTPGNMQINPVYIDVVNDILGFFNGRISAAVQSNIMELVIDPGFGFGKTMQHNFTLLQNLDVFTSLPYPVMVGLSRKSMINKVLHITSGEALNGTTVLNTIAILRGASILRVHDVKPALETIRLCEALLSSRNSFKIPENK